MAALNTSKIWRAGFEYPAHPPRTQWPDGETRRLKHACEAIENAMEAVSTIERPQWVALVSLHAFYRQKRAARMETLLQRDLFPDSPSTKPRETNSSPFPAAGSA